MIYKTNVHKRLFRNKFLKYFFGLCTCFNLKKKKRKQNHYNLLLQHMLDNSNLLFATNFNCQLHWSAKKLENIWWVLLYNRSRSNWLNNNFQSYEIKNKQKIIIIIKFVKKNLLFD